MILAFLKWEAAYATLPEDIFGQVAAFLQLFGTGWFPIVVMLLLGIVLFVVGLGPDRLEAWTNWVSRQRAGRRESDEEQGLETKERWREQDALDAYLNQMQQWLDDEDRPLATLPCEDSRRKMARTRTLAILKRLGPNGKRDVLQFLHEHELIKGDGPVVRLGTADLSNANLARMVLVDANLSGANLRRADLSDAVFNVEGGSSFSMGKAMERDAPLWIFDRFGLCANLSSADLSGAVLKRAGLAECNLLAANFAGADLEDADLRGTDLRLVRNLVQEQVEKAYGTHQQDEFLPDTMLPDGVAPPAAWSKLVHEQKAEARSKA